MSPVHTALAVPVEEDLLPLSAVLHQQGVRHRIFEEGGRQVLNVTTEGDIQRVRELYEAWREGALTIELQRKAPAASEGRSAVAQVWQQAPVTLLLIALSLCGFLLVYLRAPMSTISLFTFTPFEVVNNTLQFEAMAGQYWRLITPAFLHFGWLHITFNCLWMWELGRRTEPVIGSLHLLGLFTVIAAVSNVCQYVYGGAGIFGGLSGVVYGFLGFCWVAPLVQPRWLFRPSSGIMLFMVGWLVICLLGVVETLGFGAIANAAHLGGLLSGALLALPIAWLSRSADFRD